MDERLILSQNEANHGYLELNFLQKKVIWIFFLAFTRNYAFTHSIAHQGENKWHRNYNLHGYEGYKQNLVNTQPVNDE